MISYNPIAFFVVIHALLFVVIHALEGQSITIPESFVDDVILSQLDYIKAAEEVMKERLWD